MRRTLRPANITPGRAAAECCDRAGLAPVLYGTQAQVLAAIEQERRLELAFEGDRWFDLVRSGRAMTELDGLLDYQQLWPIPLRELDVANLPQNPGY